MEALVILIVFVVAAGAYVGARLAPSTMWKDSAEELKELTGYRNSLLERMDRGRQEGWDDVMLGQVADRLEEVEAKLGNLAKS